jgi:hypothetical protein
MIVDGLETIRQHIVFGGLWEKPQEKALIGTNSPVLHQKQIFYFSITN